MSSYFDFVQNAKMSHSEAVTKLYYLNFQKMKKKNLCPGSVNTVLCILFRGFNLSPLANFTKQQSGRSPSHFRA